MSVQPGLAGPSGSFRLVYTIFEGGGAKGITHLGALKALEQEGLVVAGAAGSSAGAIIAALVAVGYTADELFAEDGSRHILADKGKTPIDLIGRISWARYKLLRFTLGVIGLPLLVLIVGGHWPPGGFILVGLVLLWTLASFVRGRKGHGGLVEILLLLALGAAWWLAVRFVAAADLQSAMPWALAGALAAILFLAWPLFTRRGLFSSKKMRTLLNDLIRAKLEDHYRANGYDLARLPKEIRFRHIDPASVPQCVPLKIIVTDVRSGAATVFDPFNEDNRNAVVADAVAASAAIPFVFESPRIEGAMADGSPVFVDGGLISNLPVWSFRKEKRAFERKVGGPPIPVVAFTLDDGAKETGSGKLSLGEFISSVMTTGIFGSQKVVQEFVSDLIVVSLASPLDTLDFGCTPKQALAAYEAGRRQARIELAKRRLEATLTEAALQHVLSTVQPLIAASRSAKKKAMPSLRINLVEPTDALRTSFRVTASVGMSNDPDDRLELDAQNQAAPLAFRENRPVFAILKGKSSASLVMTKYEHALIPGNVNSVICCPVAKPGGMPERVLCLDSSDSLCGESKDTIFMQTLMRTNLIILRDLIAQQVVTLLPA
ncbi:MAG: patatin-like phospholipase family protein [Allosphingosinicella sp.]